LVQVLFYGILDTIFLLICVYGNIKVKASATDLDAKTQAILERYDSAYSIGSVASFNQAIIYAQELLEYGKKKKDTLILAIAYAKIALIYDTLNDDLDEAFSNYYKSYEYYKKANNLPRAGIMLSCAAVILTKQKKYQEADRYYQKSLEVYKASNAQPKHYFFTYRRLLNLAILCRIRIWRKPKFFF
jgi:tetratricopeptide (TPR) repeat protein